MFRHLLIGFIILAGANTVVGAPKFIINGGNGIGMSTGVPVTVPITVTGVTSAAGMTLSLETQPFYDYDPPFFDGVGPFSILNVVVDGPGGNTVFTGNSSSTLVVTHDRPLPDGTTLPNFLAYASLGTAHGNVVADPGIVAWVTIMARPGTSVSTLGWLTTDSSILGGSDMFDARGNDLGLGQSGVWLLSGVPEPASALLLLVGVPLVRRWRA